MAKTDDRMIAALLRERESYVLAGKTDRVALVDEQLKLRGYEPPAEEKPAAEDRNDDPASAPPRGRGGRPKTNT